jgi:acyl-CoA thioesterase FadM
VRSHVEHWGGKSFKMLHEVVRSDGVVLANGRETRVWVHNTLGEGLRSHPIPEALKKRFMLPG